MKLKIKKATRKQSKLRMAITGPAGSGKTYTALRFAHALGGRVLLFDTERGRASKYAGEVPDDIPWEFDVIDEVDSFSPDVYTQAISLAAKEGYDVLIIDSLSHAWVGKGGALEMKDRAGTSWTAWRKITPIHDRMIDAITQAPMHIIVTMRSKMKHIQEEDDKGRTVVRKAGMDPIQRAGVEYEFDVVIDMDWSHVGTVSKSICPTVENAVIDRPGPPFMEMVIEWLNSGAPSSAADVVVTETKNEIEKTTSTAGNTASGNDKQSTNGGNGKSGNDETKPPHKRARVVVAIRKATGMEGPHVINRLKKGEREGVISERASDEAAIEYGIDPDAFEPTPDDAPSADDTSDGNALDEWFPRDEELKAMPIADLIAHARDAGLTWRKRGKGLEFGNAAEHVELANAIRARTAEVLALEGEEN